MASMNKEIEGLLEAVVGELREGVLLADAQGRVEFANATAKTWLALGAPAPSLEAAFAGLRLAPELPELRKSGDAALAFEALRETSKPLVLAGTVRRFARERRAASPLWLWVFRDATEERREEILKRQFLGLISHKLRSPLSIVFGYCHVLEQDEALGAQARQAAQVIGRKSRELSAQIEKLLRFTWLEGTGQGALRKESAALKALWEDSLRRFAADLERGALVARRGPGLEQRLAVDPALFRDALENLVENALKFKRGPSVSVGIEAARSGSRVEVSVRDDGPGIPPEDLERVFSRFYQVEEFFTGQVQGWGLGLPFVAEVMKAHGGGARLESKLGQGTAVILTVPAGEP